MVRAIGLAQSDHKSKWISRLSINLVHFKKSITQNHFMFSIEIPMYRFFANVDARTCGNKNRNDSSNFVDVSVHDQASSLK